MRKPWFIGPFHLITALLGVVVGFVLWRMNQEYYYHTFQHYGVWGYGWPWVSAIPSGAGHDGRDAYTAQMNVLACAAVVVAAMVLSEVILRLGERWWNAHRRL